MLHDSRVRYLLIDPDNLYSLFHQGHVHRFPDIFHRLEYAGHASFDYGVYLAPTSQFVQDTK